jgi:hypothetical protein
MTTAMEMTMTKTTMKTWHFGKGGKLVIGAIECANLDEAARIAAKWNRDCAKGMRVEIVMNAPVAAYATAVRAVY